MREYKKKKENEQGKMCKDFVDYSIPVLSLSQLEDNLSKFQRVYTR